MDHLGHQRFYAVGHDRGVGVAFRIAMDHPDRVRALVVMDGIPRVEALERCDAKFARLSWHWFFLAQPEIPERVIGADPDAWYHLDERAMGPLGYAEMNQAIHSPATVLAMIEDYRAGIGVDADDERADRIAGRRIGCPTLVLWSSRDDMEELYGDPVAIWAGWAGDVRGHPIESGHHLAEENPRDLAQAPVEFFGERREDDPAPRSQVRSS